MFLSFDIELLEMLLLHGYSKWYGENEVNVPKGN